MRLAGSLAGAAASALVGLLVLGGCTDDPVDTANIDSSASKSTATEPSTPSTTPTETSTPEQSGTVRWAPREKKKDDTVQAVLAGYRKFMQVTTTLQGAPDPDDPRINQVATGDAEANLIDTLSELADSGHSRVGPITLRPLIAALQPGAGTATVYDCADYSRYGTDKPLDPPEEKSKFRPMSADLVRADDTWVVSAFTTASSTACSGAE